MKKLYTIIIWAISINLSNAQTLVTDTLTTSGNFVVPTGVDTITVQCWGAGGKGGYTWNPFDSGKGGGGGAYASSVIPVVSGNNYPFRIGISGVDSTSSTSFDNDTVLAEGGRNGQLSASLDPLGGSISGSIGQIKFSGGNGFHSLTAYSGGGGGGAGSTQNGNNAVASSAGTGGFSGGGNGGAGRLSIGYGAAGSSYGGGGGGGYSSNSMPYSGGFGGQGVILISYIQPTTTGTLENISNYTFAISPNPFTSQTTITFNAEQKHTTVKITDLLGKEIKTIIYTGRQLVIDKAETKSGIYFVQTTDEQKHICNRKIIIQ